ncbi:Uncharacterised protein [Vibrio cholerae]|uniref:Uncharacterized protein n=1 Tax=Vibrio cholerae TaxID=666 RepID=A0A655YLP6_VIBCL|nr:Uncharacterised protein [Vibrio cholerae]
MNKQSSRLGLRQLTHRSAERKRSYHQYRLQIQSYALFFLDEARLHSRRHYGFSLDRGDGFPLQAKSEFLANSDHPTLLVSAVGNLLGLNRSKSLNCHD